MLGAIQCKQCKKFYNGICNRKVVVRKFFGLFKKTYISDWCTNGIYDYEWRKKHKH